MTAYHALEPVDRRVLGAFRFVSAIDGSPIRHPLTLRRAPQPAGPPANADEAAPLKLLRNRRGLYVIVGGVGFDDYVLSFDAPSVPPVASRRARLRVEDPSGAYFPAEVSLPLPRSTAPGDASGGTVFVEQVVPLLPSPKAPTAGGWAVWRIIVWRDSDGAVPPHQQKAPVALIRMLSTTQKDGGGNPVVLARALTDWRRGLDGGVPGSSEALAAVPGVPVTNWNQQPGGAVVTTGLDVVLEIRMDPQFDASAPDALPDLTRLDAPPGAPPAPGVVSGRLPLHLEAGDRRSLHTAFDLAGATLRTIGPGALNFENT